MQSAAELPEYLDHAFLDRVRRGYHLAIAESGATAGMWRDIDARRADIHAALLADANDALREIFRDPIATDLFYGADGLCRSILGENSGIYAGWVGDFCKSKLAAAARAVRISEERDFTVLDCERVLTELDHMLNQHVDFPSPFRGELGLSTTRGIASERPINALYQTWRLQSLLTDNAEKSVVEIGPGIGRTAYYAYQAGIRDYTTIDLPMGIVAQACFLGAVLGPEKLWMIGDAEQLSQGRIVLLPGTRKPERKFAVALNVDSMTEMPLLVALDYIKWIRGHSRVFLSINHSDNEFTVRHLAAGSFKTAEQQPYAMREGYMEEVFIPCSSGGGWQRARAISWLVAMSLGRRARNFLQQQASRLKRLRSAVKSSE